jgi:hypothetical protein
MELWAQYGSEGGAIAAEALGYGVMKPTSQLYPLREQRRRGSALAIAKWA